MSHLAPISAAGANTSLRELENIYDNWATTYDQDLSETGYMCPENVARAVTKHFSASQQPKILDMAAGTGMVGKHLRDLGYTNLDATDMSDASLAIALKKLRKQNSYWEVNKTGDVTNINVQGLYNKTFRCVMGEEPLPVEPAAYNAITIVGCFSVPVKVAAFDEMHRVIRPGGVLIATFRPDVWDETDKFGYRGYFDVNRQKWQQIGADLVKSHDVEPGDKVFYPKWWMVTYRKI